MDNTAYNNSIILAKQCDFPIINLTSVANTRLNIYNRLTKYFTPILNQEML
jgi:hypothetical protein